MIQQRKWTLLVLALFAAGSGLFCGSPAAQDASEQSTSPEVAARVGDRTISLVELDEVVKKQNATAYQAFYDARRAALEQMISEMVINIEAESRGVTVEDLQNELIKTSEPVSDAEIEAFFTSQQSRMGGRSLDQMREQIKTHLLTTKNQTKIVAYVNDLKRKSGVKVMLSPPRIELTAAANEPSKGPQDAPILLVEYSDFQ
jgi:hypothetical protein